MTKSLEVSYLPIILRKSYFYLLWKQSTKKNLNLPGLCGRAYYLGWA